MALLERKDGYMGALVRGLVAGAFEVRTAQRSCWAIGGASGVEEKLLDRTQVTDTDRASERRIMDGIGTPDGLSVRSEEGSTAGAGDHEAVNDPLDGTSEFLLGGLCSTTGGGLIGPDGKLYAAATVVPADGHVFLTEPGRSTTLNLIDGPLDNPNSWRMQNLHKVRDLRAWDGEFTRSCVAWIDRTAGWTNEVHGDVLDDLETALFLAGLMKHMTLRANGSNLHHQALVAGGRPNAAASITLAKGGDQDLVGVMHVIGAGGVARGYNVTGVGPERRLVPVDDVLKIREYAILVTAMRDDVLGCIEDVLTTALRVAGDPRAGQLLAQF